MSPYEGIFCIRRWLSSDGLFKGVCCLKLLWSSRFTSILYECQSFTQSRAVWIIRAFPSSYPFLHNWKLLNQLDTKKCIWYGRAQMSKCFCSVMWVVVKLDFKIERICCFCLELFSFESFVLPAVHRKKLPKEMFHFFLEVDFIVVVIVATLIIIISSFFFFTCVRMIWKWTLGLHLWWILSMMWVLREWL